MIGVPPGTARELSPYTVCSGRHGSPTAEAMGARTEMHAGGNRGTLTMDNPPMLVALPPSRKWWMRGFGMGCGLKKWIGLASTGNVTVNCWLGANCPN